ncbi:hypothetical protein OV079_16225 [Nannocystis pusilla]|uniref:Uncharacterized protein n=1 Tax=Nannocystis pusilla TaxID=889268 RepID=A0A9X3IX43_9BACT|nr:hypothetical protein [Nannocystis pusilla]MCY1007076.1 hypothetical protein [Nannocystis pusilla]
MCEPELERFDPEPPIPVLREAPTLLRARASGDRGVAGRGPRASAGIDTVYFELQTESGSAAGAQIKEVGGSSR